MRRLILLALSVLVACGPPPVLEGQAEPVDFNVTGLVVTDNGALWAGAVSGGDDPSLLRLDPETLRPVETIPLPGKSTVQGLAFYRGCMWAALSDLLALSRTCDGRTDLVPLGYRPNGLVVVDGRLLASDYRKVREVATGRVLFLSPIPIDQMVYHRGDLWISSGNNGQPGKIVVLTKASHPRLYYRAPGAPAIEGLAFMGDTLLIASDGEFHGVGHNAILRVPM